MLHEHTPGAQIRLWCIDMEFSTNDIIQPLLLQHVGYLVQRRHRSVFEYTLLWYIAKQGKLITNPLLQRAAAARYDDIRKDTIGLQLVDRVLSRL